MALTSIPEYFLNYKFIAIVPIESVTEAEFSGNKKSIQSERISIAKKEFCLNLNFELIF